MGIAAFWPKGERKPRKKDRKWRRRRRERWPLRRIGGERSCKLGGDTLTHFHVHFYMGKESFLWEN